MRPWLDEVPQSFPDERLRRRWERLLQRERLARERQEVLAEAGGVFSASLDYEITLRRVVELCVPLLGDFGFFDVDEGDGEVQRLALAPQDAERQRLLNRTRWETPPLPLHGLARSGRPRVVSRLDRDGVGRLELSPAESALLDQLKVASLLVVPLHYQVRSLGSLILCLGQESGRRHGHGDLTLAVELAQRAAAAVENARLFRQGQEAVRKRDEFLSVASHELKTPLTTLELQVTALLRGLRLGRVHAGDSEEVANRLDRVERQVQRLNAVIEELLDGSRMAGERLRLRRGEFDFMALVEEVVRAQQAEAERVGSDVQLTLERVTFVGDRPRLEQAVSNLLVNALKFGAGKTVELSLSRTPGGVRLQVADHGIGIAPEDQIRIFERFERAVSPRKFSGFGLGLWRVKQIIEAHGGRVGVISVLGVGSAFTVDLPA
jgi:signal transduction histidine kinase